MPVVEALRQRNQVAGVVICRTEQLAVRPRVLVHAALTVVEAPFRDVVAVPPDVFDRNFLLDDAELLAPSVDAGVVLRVGAARRDPVAVPELSLLHVGRDAAVHRYRVFAAVENVANVPYRLLAHRIGVALRTWIEHDKLKIVDVDAVAEVAERRSVLHLAVLRRFDALRLGLEVGVAAWSRAVERARSLVAGVVRVAHALVNFALHAPHGLHVAALHGVRIRGVLFGRDSLRRHGVPDDLAVGWHVLGFPGRRDRAFLRRHGFAARCVARLDLAGETAVSILIAACARREALDALHRMLHLVDDLAEYAPHPPVVRQVADFRLVGPGDSFILPFDPPPRVLALLLDSAMLDAERIHVCESTADELVRIKHSLVGVSKIPFV